MANQPITRVRSFEINRARTITGSGVTLKWGVYRFVLVNQDGAPERTLDDAGFQHVLDAIVMRFEDTPSVSPKEGRA